MPFGAQQLDHGVRFRIWAPDCKYVSLCLEGPRVHREIPLKRDPNGWCEIVVDDAGPGTRYRYRIDDGLQVPDPASRFQPDDLHGASEVIDPRAFPWQTAAWQGLLWGETVLYELHVGTFTPQGTYQGVIDRLDHLVDLGVTAIELMPVADFPGRRDWGYNGAALFAPDASYGRPEDLKALIDAAHGRGLMVFLDVVYNHFGPEGNYLHTYASRFFDHDRHTPWGAAISFDRPGSRDVRDFFIHNALYWIQEYRIDGLRFDAVHAIEDRSMPDILEELAETVHQRIGSDRHVHLVLENDDNKARYLSRTKDNRPQWYVAQWNDDIHHAYHVLLTGENSGYYADYADASAHLLGRCLAEGFAYQGDPSPFRDGAVRGELSAHLPPTAFVDFIQNHDQVGNRAFGDRISQLTSPEAMEAATAILLLAPAPPMLFMGQEWAARQPFLFFCDLGEDLSDSVRDGRRREFASFPEFQDPAARQRIPDPTIEETFRKCLLDWADLEVSPHRETLAYHRDLLAIRRSEIVPRLDGIQGHAGRAEIWGPGGMLVEWKLGDGSLLSLVANMGAAEAAPPPRLPQGRLIFTNGESAGLAQGKRLAPWAVAWFLGGAAS
jgi:1,4-alpha-glucan branching enzyme/maltooligosyltrehalose trehalohydrolase